VRGDPVRAGPQQSKILYCEDDHDRLNDRDSDKPEPEFQLGIELLRAVSAAVSLHRSLPGAVGGGGAVELPGAGLEGGDHAAHRFVEQHLDHLLQNP
jgi:hypothetical protein